MLEIFWTENKSVYEKLEKLLARRLDGNYEIARTANGKPYIEGNPLFFSLSHSGGSAVIAVSGKPVGVDIEEIKERQIASVLSNFTGRERQEIQDSLTAFYKNWTVKEAYIKLNGGTLAHDLKRLEYFGNTLYYDGQKVGCGYGIRLHDKKFLCAVCAEGYSEEEIAATQINQI
ncbi:MAG: 4'-phosphopantetheinyl transferase superfamily protein [Clostridia bacterium]|nr:4'-phosphopantetheinyl transferase superfamily protein [Clostridia bacterium]